MPIGYLLGWSPSDLSDIRFFEKPATLPYFRTMLKAALITLLILALLALAGTWYLATHVLPYAIIQPGNKSGSKTPADFGLAYEHLRLQATDIIELSQQVGRSPLANKQGLMMKWSAFTLLM